MSYLIVIFLYEWVVHMSYVIVISLYEWVVITHAYCLSANQGVYLAPKHVYVSILRLLLATHIKLTIYITFYLLLHE